MKKKCLFVGIIILIVMLSGCDTYGMFEYYPYHRADKWYCREIDCEIVFSKGEDGRLISDPVASFEWEGKNYDALVGFIGSYICFDFDEDGDGRIKSILDGFWKYQDGNLIVYNFESSVFRDAFTELVFVPQ